MDDKVLLNTVNQSGFPFQIGVRNEIERTAVDHGWKVVAEEHSWTHPERGSGGFIDLIAEHDPYIFSLVIECKRVRTKHSAQGPSWIFLTPVDYTNERDRLSVFVTKKRRDDRSCNPPRKPLSDVWGWADGVSFDPPTPEASYCVFETQDEKNPTIDRIADTLLPSVESVGREWLTHGDVLVAERRVFLPVIVTNATLYTCDFEAAKVGLADGGLREAVFREVPLVRFRKSLTTGPNGDRIARNFADANRRQQRSLLIANAASLAETLKSLLLKDEGSHVLWNRLQQLNPPEETDA